MEPLSAFSQRTLESIGSYVYCLIDPDGKIFYVGSGLANRVFSHELEALNPSLSSPKIDRIREIKNAGGVVEKRLIRWDLTPSEALMLESSIIDVLGLGLITNAVSGWHSQYKKVEEVELLYSALPIVPAHRILGLKLNKHYPSVRTSDDLYKVTKEAWALNVNKAQEAEVVLGIFFGIVRGVFLPVEWYEAERVNPKRKRYGFNGKIAPDEVYKLYYGKYVANSSKRGATNPVFYINY